MHKQNLYGIQAAMTLLLSHMSAIMRFYLFYLCEKSPPTTKPFQLPEKRTLLAENVPFLRKTESAYTLPMPTPTSGNRPLHI
jgi:hypothetical protein